MQFDFTTIWDRAGKDAIAVDGFGRPGFGPTDEAKKRNEEAKKEGGGFDLLPMWVADMNFATCPAIPEEIIRRAEHPLFGYYGVPELYYERIISWQKERNGVTGLEKKHIAYENGVL
ncbi:MAG: aspartate aminotransferase, partial [Lachnospiraceae bacterium]|nr:aspartate aminotransferase [Lachnospiraceae bacterium]